ncbi:MAG: YeeE/YedE family protein [Sphingobacteriales bacterium]|nr:YeeE/YedE family protein [Sphingobacteriales bacterium]
MNTFFVDVNAPQINQETAEQEQIRHQDMMCTNESHLVHPWWYNLKYLAIGLFFGITFVKAEIVSWFRIQEMFQLTSFHMYGVIGTAVLVGMLSVAIIKKYNIKSIHGETITLDNKTFNKGQIYGGLIFGIGWAITGACPGPLFTQIGSGFGVVFITLLSAIAGTWVYGYLRPRLPH